MRGEGLSYTLPHFARHVSVSLSIFANEEISVDRDQVLPELSCTADS